MVVPQAGDAPRRVRRARLPDRLGLEGLPGDRRRLRDRAARGLRESDRLPEPIFTPSTKADVGHDEAIDFEGAVELVGDRALAERAARRVDRGLPARRRPRARARDHPRRHEVRVRPRRRRHADARRRGADARLLALLARRRVRARPRASRASTSSSCATGRPSTGWDRTPPAPAIPDDVVASTRAKYVEAYERITGEPFGDVAGAGPRRGADARPRARQAARRESSIPRARRSSGRCRRSASRASATSASGG